GCGVFAGEEEWGEPARRAGSGGELGRPAFAFALLPSRHLAAAADDRLLARVGRVDNALLRGPGIFRSEHEAILQDIVAAANQHRHGRLALAVRILLAHGIASTGQGGEWFCLGAGILIATGRRYHKLGL